MTSLRSTVVRSALVVSGLLALHELLAWGLDRTDLIERLLAPQGEGVVPAVALGGTFLVLRLTLLFVVPGAVLTRVVAAWWTARRGLPRVGDGAARTGFTHADQQE